MTQVKRAWFILLVSAATDFSITAGTSWMALSGSNMPITRESVITVLAGGIIAFSRTIQQALKSTPALWGDLSNSVPSK